jgi:hypothetical protein
VQRKERVFVLRGRGVRPAKKLWAVRVDTTAITIPAWPLAKRDVRFSVSERHVWFRGRNSGNAKILERQNRQAGGRPELTSME